MLRGRCPAVHGPRHRHVRAEMATIIAIPASAASPRLSGASRSRCADPARECRPRRRRGKSLPPGLAVVWRIAPRTGQRDDRQITASRALRHLIDGIQSVVGSRLQGSIPSRAGIGRRCDRPIDRGMRQRARVQAFAVAVRSPRFAAPAGPMYLRPAWTRKFEYLSTVDCRMKVR